MADASFGDPVALGSMLCTAGCRIIQLRAKGWPPAEVRHAARQLLPTIRRHGGLLIINDHPEVAASVGADGVHVGQDDGDIQGVRRLIGPDRILGLSTHTITQVTQAQQHADYIGFGPVFGTRTKATGYAPRGIDLLHEAVRTSAIPVVAIGGINANNVSQVRASGVRCWAIISAILSASSPDKAAAHYAAMSATQGG